MTYNNELVVQYYTFALDDLSKNGVSVSDMEYILTCFEESENYEACEGVFEAIKDYKQINSKHE